MSFLILPPAVSTLESRIRALGASSLPQTQNFWYEDISQIPAKLQQLPFQVLTDYPSEPHELYIDEKLFKRFVPATSAFTLNLVFNPGIYSGRLVHPRTGATAEITFQISVRELLWWAWAQLLLGPLQRLENLEQRFNSPLHLAVFEASYPQDILALNSSQWAVRSFAQAGHLKNVSGSTKTFIGALMGTPVDALEPQWELRDRRADFSQAQFPFVDSTISRRTAFLVQDYNLVIASSWNHGVLLDPPTPVESQVPGITSSLLVKVRTDQGAFDPLQAQIQGFHEAKRRFNLAVNPRFVSTIVGMATVAVTAPAGSHSLTLVIAGGTISLKPGCLLRITGHADLVKVLDPLELPDGQQCPVTTELINTPIPAGARVGVYSASTDDFPTLHVLRNQTGSVIEVSPEAAGAIQAGTKIIFNNDPTVFELLESVVFEANQLTTLALAPTPDCPKIVGDVGRPFTVAVTKVSAQEWEYQTSPWYIAESLDVYCALPRYTTQGKSISMYPGANEVDFLLEAINPQTDWQVGVGGVEAAGQADSTYVQVP
jgi:hypothetical protein